MTCDGCRFTLEDFILMIQGEDQLLYFLEQHGCILKEKKCPKCGEMCTNKVVKRRTSLTDVESNLYYFRCQKSCPSRSHKAGKQNKRCNFIESINKNTFFFNTKLSRKNICLFILYELIGISQKLSFHKGQFGMSSKTIIDYCSFIREIYIDWATKTHCGKIGGEDELVEIEETKLGKMKINCGLLNEEQYIFGGIQKSTNNFFFIPIQNRKSETFVNLIKKNIEPGTTILSNNLQPCDILSKEEYEDLTVNYNINFLASPIKPKTPKIERLLLSKDCMPKLQKYGRKSSSFGGYLAEFLFKRYHKNHLDRVHHFFIAMGQLYNPNEELKINESVHYDEEEFALFEKEHLSDM